MAKESKGGWVFYPKTSIAVLVWWLAVATTIFTYILVPFIIPGDKIIWIGFLPVPAQILALWCGMLSYAVIFGIILNLRWRVSEEL